MRWIFTLKNMKKDNHYDGDEHFYTKILACAGLGQNYIYINLKRIKDYYDYSGDKEEIDNAYINKICIIISHEVLHHAIDACKSEKGSSLSYAWDNIARKLEEYL